MSESTFKLLDSYSDFHDAVVLDVHLRGSLRELTVTVEAEEFESETRHNLVIDCSLVSLMQLLPPVQTDSSLSDYLFPVERTIDRVSVEERGDDLRVSVFGTYGWKLLVDCRSASLSRL